MRTRKFFVNALYDIEHRTDGFYFRQLQSKEDWSGPYRNIGAVAEAMAEELEEQMRLCYELLTPR